MQTRDIEQISKEIYRNCVDELSRTIFTDKMLYAMTGEYKYIQKLVKDSIADVAQCIERIAKTDKVVIYGAGENLEFIFSCLQENGISIQYICDRSKQKQGKTYNNIPIISPDKLIQDCKDAKIVISTTTYLNEVMCFLQEYFEPQQIIPFLSDKQMEYIHNQYFDDIIQLNDNEVFVDGGCYDFGTSERLLSRCTAKKIYAFEPDINNLKKVNESIERKNLKNVEVIPAGMWDSNTKLHFSAQGSIMSRVDEKGTDEIEVVAIDQVVSGRVTFIKMDIEGSELKALRGAENVIKAYKPKMAICIYHKPEDIFDIPAYIQSIVPEYKFCIRHYALNASETVLYAVV